MSTAEQIADEIYGLHCDIGRLEVENARRQEMVASLTDRSFRMADKMNCLQAENTKLRTQLADVTESMGRIEERCAKLREQRDYYKALWEHTTATDCELRRVRSAWKEDREKNDKLRELVDYMTPIAWYAASERERDRMRELGVEPYDRPRA